MNDISNLQVFNTENGISGLQVGTLLPIFYPGGWLQSMLVKGIGISEREM
jgi:hypothetical protein